MEETQQRCCVANGDEVSEVKFTTERVAQSGHAKKSARRDSERSERSAQASDLCKVGLQDNLEHLGSRSASRTSP